jgi:transposase InsO family protein
VVDFSKESISSSTCLIAKVDEGWLWHRQLGHVNMRNIKRLLKGEHVVGLTNIMFEKDRVCSACAAGKQLGKNHPAKSVISTTRPLELLHLDLFGPSTYDTLGGRRYGLLIMDDYSINTWVFLLKSKDETHKFFTKFAKQMERTFEEVIKTIRIDNGSEFKNDTMEDFMGEVGIKHEFSAPYTPQQNGVVERKNWTIIEMARTMLDEFKSPHNFWGEAIATAVHVSNHLSSQMSPTSASSDASASSRTRRRDLVNSSLEQLRVFLLAMRTIPTPIDTTTYPLDVLKYLVTWYSRNLVAPKSSKLFQVM